MIHRSLRTATLCAVLAAVPAFAETTPTDLLGTWQTGIGEQPAPDGGTAYLRATTVFTEASQDIIFEIYADPDLQTKLFEYHSSGPWLPQGPSPAIPEALAVNMTNDFSRVTILVDAPDLWAALNMGDCPLRIGEAVDVTACVSGPPFSVTDSVDLDIVMVDQGGKRLRYGGGDVNRCLTRPTEMSANEFLRVE